MKNLYVLLLFLIPLTGFSQTWFEIGGRGMYGITALYDSGITDNDNHTMNLNTGFSYGPTLNVNFGDKHGIAAEVLFANAEQSWDVDPIGINSAFTNTLNWESTDLYLLYRTKSRGAYLELGPKYSMVNMVEQTREINGNKSKSDVSQYYADQHLSAVLGFGMYLAGSKAFTLTLGFRLEYSFADFTSDEGVDLNVPIEYDPTYERNSLNNINAMGALELRIPIGGVAKAGCGQRRFIFGG